MPRKEILKKNISHKNVLTIKQASLWASKHLNKKVSESNISYLIQYGKERILEYLLIQRILMGSRIQFLSFMKTGKRDNLKLERNDRVLEKYEMKALTKKLVDVIEGTTL